MVPRVLCVTGGMGAGKTLAVEFFRDLGWPIYPSDQRAKQVVAHSPKIQSDLIHAFGPDAIGPDGAPNAKYLGTHAFSSPANWTTLNKIIHPAVQEDFIHWLESFSETEVPWVVRESALLFEVGIHHTCDRILLITAPESIRQARVVARSPEHLPESLYKRMAFQWDDDKKRALLRSQDTEISNDASQEIFLNRLAHWYSVAFKS